jgi:hypothetical protein
MINLSGPVYSVLATKLAYPGWGRSVVLEMTSTEIPALSAVTV